MVTVEGLVTATEKSHPGGSTPPSRRRFGPAALLLISVALWLFALTALRETTVGHYGLVASKGGLVLLGSALVAIVAFVWAIALRQNLLAVLGIAAVALIYRVTATLLTEMPLYVWTYKHIGIADYMSESHTSPNIQIYGDWPSFFAGMAWFSSVSGADPLTVAHWFAPVASILIALLAGTLVVSAGFSTRAALIASMLAIVLNWTGQDYYSPQAAGLILTLSVLSLSLYSKRTVLAGYLSIPLLAVLVATHQLTPFWLLFVLVALAVFKQMRPRWLPLVYLAILLVYVFPRLDRAAKFDVFSGFNPIKNSSVVAEEVGSAGREFTLLLERGLFAALWFLAAVCVLVIWRRRGAPWGLVIIAFSPVLILGGQDYGGEAIIRVYLYSIAGCAALVSIVMVWIIDCDPPWLRTVGCLATALVITGFGAIGLHGYYGGWSYVTVSSAQVEHSRQLLESTEGKYVIGTLAQNVGWPEQSTADSVRVRLQDPAYDSVFDGIRPSLLHKDFATPQDVEMIEGVLPRNGRARALYVVIPDQVQAYGEYIGWYPATFVPSLVELLSRTPRWTRVVDGDDTVIFEYRPEKR